MVGPWSNLLACQSPDNASTHGQVARILGGAPNRNHQPHRKTQRNASFVGAAVDVCAILTASPDAGAYWRKLKQRLNAEGEVNGP